MKVFAFDRDHTVDVSPHPSPEKEMVPLDWVRRLSGEHEVWAIGNQKLKKEADIPGLQELVRGLDNEWYEKLGEKVDDEYHDDFPTREERLHMLSELFPNADEYIVVDDADLNHVEGWNHYHAWDFVSSVREDEIENVELD